jgi:hypothetical protein
MRYVSAKFILWEVTEEQKKNYLSLASDLLELGESVKDTVKLGYNKCSKTDYFCSL